MAVKVLHFYRGDLANKAMKNVSILGMLHFLPVCTRIGKDPDGKASGSFVMTDRGIELHFHRWRKVVYIDLLYFTALPAAL